MKTRKWITLVFTVLMALSAGAFAAACGDDAVTLSFETNGGNEIPPCEAKPGEQFTLPVPEKEGGVFGGWYPDGSLSGEPFGETVTVPSKDTTYYAGWSEGYKLTLDTDGGDLSRRELWLEEGANVYEAVRSLVPERAGLTFGAWFDGEEELSASKRMPAGELTLTARYLAPYRIEVWLQDLSQRDYVLSAENEGSGSAYLGVEFAPEAPAVQGFGVHGGHAGEVSSLKLGTGENVYRFYYDRLSFSVSYDANEPEGVAEGYVAGEDVLYGAAVSAARNLFTLDGFRFAGWSTHADGGVEYAEGAQIVVEENLVLYAVWDRGYIDRYGGRDLIYLPQLEDEVAILVRGGREFYGTRTEDGFSFDLPNGDVLKGKIYGTTFAFYRQAVAGTYYGYDYSSPGEADPEQRVDRGTVLSVDEYQNATFTEPGEAALNGVILSVDPDYGEYAFVISEGEYTGEGFLLKIIHVEDEEGNVTPAFARSRNEGGVYYEFVTADGRSGAQGYGTIYLDGFGGLIYANMDTGEYAEGEYSIVKEYINSVTGDILYKIEGYAANEYVDLETGRFYEERVELAFCTASISNDLPGYVNRSVYAGEYAGKGELAGDTLTLDGYGYLADSAIYTSNGVTVEGSYAIGQSAMRDATVTIYPGDGTEYRFTLGADDFAVYDASVSEGWTAYYWFTDGDMAGNYDLYLPLLAIYGDPAKGDVRAELFYQNQQDYGYFSVATGSVSSRALGTNGLLLYTFTRETVVEGYESRVKKSMVFLLNSVTNGGDHFNVYYLIEDEGAPLYTVHHSADEGGGEIWDLSFVEGLGSLYFAPDGRVYEGSLSVSENYFGENIGTYTWINAEEERYNYFYFRVYEAADGTVTFSRLDTAPEETAYFYVPASGEIDYTMATLITDEQNRALYARDGDWAQGVRGTFTQTSSTFLGKPIYTLRGEDGAKIWDFVIEEGIYNDPLEGSLPIHYYWIYQEAYAGDVESEQNGTLTLDGFHEGVYRSADRREFSGTYTIYAIGVNRTAVIFTATSGDKFIFELTADGFDSLDGAYGNYTVEYNGTYALSFDGRGIVDLCNASTLRPYTTGTYRILGDADGALECLITIDLDVDGRPRAYTVRLADGRCELRNDEQYGAFIDDEWNVLVLDGYNRGAYYAADGSDGISGYFNLVNEQDGFAFLRFQDYSEFYFLLDADAKTFSVPGRPSEDRFYYTADFSKGVTFGLDGFSYVGNESGYYNLKKDGAVVYLMLGTGGFRRIELPVTQAETFSYAGDEYHLWHGETVEAEGEITFDGEYEPIRATLRFLPDGNTLLDVRATLTVGSDVYTLSFVNAYYDEIADAARFGAFLRFSDTYTPIVLRYVAGGSDNGFSAQGGVTQEVRYDYAEDYAELEHVSKLVLEYFGFGPIRLTEPVLYGELYYAPVMKNGEPLRFTADPDDVRTDKQDAAHGARSLLVFEADGAMYAMNYYTPYSNFYELYAFMTYEISKASPSVSVGFGRYLYSNESYEFYRPLQIGELFAVDLFENGDVVPQFDSGMMKDGAWLVALGQYDPAADQGELGSGYLIGYTEHNGSIVSVEVGEYAFRQAAAADGYSYLNFLLDEEGKPIPVAVLAYIDDVFQTLVIESSAATEDGFVLVCSDGRTYEVTFLYDEDGEWLTDSGEWIVSVEVRETE